MLHEKINWEWPGDEAKYHTYEWCIEKYSSCLLPKLVYKYTYDADKIMYS